MTGFCMDLYLWVHCMLILLIWSLGVGCLTCLTHSFWALHPEEVGMPVRLSCVVSQLVKIQQESIAAKTPSHGIIKSTFICGDAPCHLRQGFFRGSRRGNQNQCDVHLLSLSLWEVLPLKIRQEERLFSPAPSVLCPLLSQHPSPLVKPLPGGRASHQGQALWPGLPGNTAFTCILFSPGGPSAAEARC